MLDVLSAVGLVVCCVCVGLAVSGLASPEEQATRDRQQTKTRIVASSFFIELPPIICGNSTISQSMRKKCPIGVGLIPQQFLPLALLYN